MSNAYNFADNLHQLSKGNINNYSVIAEEFAKMGKVEEAISVMNLYEKSTENNALKYITCANFYNVIIKDYEKAIYYYEKYIQLDNTQANVYFMLARLYSVINKDNNIEKQFEYLKKANELQPGQRQTLSALALRCRKLCLTKEAAKYYEELMNSKPLPVDYFNYGAFLISCGNFLDGHKYFKYRNLIAGGCSGKSLTTDIESLKLLESDLSSKTVLVKYEGGFGDTIMYCRFLPLLKMLCRKVIFIVQKPLYLLIKSSNIFKNIEIYTEDTDICCLKYDIPVMLLDLPLIINGKCVINFNSNGEYLPPLADKYLNIKEYDIHNYAKKNIKNSKNLKIGIAYSGNKTSNYEERDIDISYFNKIACIKNIQMYSLQKKDFNLPDYIIPLSKSFIDFYDTACAIKNMDLIISSDNVILNLAGALGVKTIGLFNKYTNYRWYKLSGDDVGWYKSVKPIRAKVQDDWESVFADLRKELDLI